MRRLLALLLVVQGCAAAPPLTTAQSETLAAARYLGYRASGAAFEARLTFAGRESVLRGAVDWRGGVAGGLIASGDGEPARLAWSRTTLAVQRTDGGWVYRGLRPAAAVVDSALVLLHSLAADRPDNPQLLAEQGARFQRSEGTLGVYRGPAAGRPGSQYWIGAEGRIERFEAADGAILIRFSGYGRQRVDLPRAVTSRLTAATTPAERGTAPTRSP